LDAIRTPITEEATEREIVISEEVTEVEDTGRRGIIGTEITRMAVAERIDGSTEETTGEVETITEVEIGAIEEATVEVVEDITITAMTAKGSMPTVKGKTAPNESTVKTDKHSNRSNISRSAKRA